MTKQELISKLDELGGRVEDLMVNHNQQGRELKELKDALDDLPGEADEIDDDDDEKPVKNESPVGESDE